MPRSTLLQHCADQVTEPQKEENLPAIEGPTETRPAPGGLVSVPNSNTPQAQPTPQGATQAATVGTTRATTRKATIAQSQLPTTTEAPQFLAQV